MEKEERKHDYTALLDIGRNGCPGPYILRPSHPPTNRPSEVFFLILNMGPLEIVLPWALQLSHPPRSDMPLPLSAVEQEHLISTENTASTANSSGTPCVSLFIKWAKV